MRPELWHDALRRNGPCPRIQATQKQRGHGPLLQERKQSGFGLVAAMFLIIVIAGVIAAMARMAITQNATSGLSIQQARAFQAANAGLEWGIHQFLNGNDCNTASPFTQEGFGGFQVSVICPATSGHRAVHLISEETSQEIVIQRIIAIAQYNSKTDPDYAYRQLSAVVEKED